MSEINFEKTAVKVSMVSIIGNIVLSTVKLIAGIIAHSGAMVSDAVHSASDVFSSIIVISACSCRLKSPTRSTTTVTSEWSALRR